ncbi:MAG: hypothetical protein GY954_04115, partial [Alteromonas sp.]|nr:hypothetical protein [Alteromonas sp.]
APKEGLSASIEKTLKDLRFDINEALQGKSKAYAKVNTSYSRATQGLSDFQNAAGKSIDLFGPESDAATGRVLRKLLSNMQNRENLAAAMKQIEEIAVEHGGKYTDDLTAQAKAVNEFERLMGSFAESSFKGEIGSAAKNVAGMPTPGKLAEEGLKLTASQAKKIRNNQTTQLKALEALVN